MTSGTEKQQAIESALEHFGLGATTQKLTGHIVAEVVRLTIKTMFVRPIETASGFKHPNQIELFRVECSTDYINLNDEALIMLPLSYVNVFGLQGYVLEASEVEKYQAMARRFVGL